MERHLDDELQKLNTNLLKIATLAETAIHKSMEALKQLNKDMALEIIRDDQVIDDLENQIEEEIIELLALYQPMAKDLRFITMAMSFTMQVERVADLTVNISQRVLEIVEQKLGHVKPLIDLPQLGDTAKWMLKSTIDAFVNRNENLAREVILRDVEANELRTAIMNELIYECMVKDGSCSPRAVPLLLVARDLERICDLAKAVAQDTIYLVNAKIVRHHPERLQNSD